MQTKNGTGNKKHLPCGGNWELYTQLHNIMCLVLVQSYENKTVD